MSPAPCSLFSGSAYSDTNLQYNGMIMPGGGSMSTSETFNDVFSYNPEIVSK